MRQCPECGTINPPTTTGSLGHYYVKCAASINTKQVFFGMITKDIKCGRFLEFDEDDDWIYFRRVNRITKDLPKPVGLMKYL